MHRWYSTDRAAGGVGPVDAVGLHVGGAAAEFIEGGDGPDTILGGGADDTLFGGPGDDALSGGAGDDQLDGRSGPSAGGTAGAEPGDDTIEGGAGDDTIVGGGGGDLLRGGADVVEGSLGEDTIRGGGGGDVLFGGDGLSGGQRDNGLDTADGLLGGAGRDLLDGGAGDDTLRGGADADTLIGGRGADHLVGGDGEDSFVYNALYRGRFSPPLRSGVESPPDAPDRILDFEGAGAAGGDVIDLRRIAAAAPADGGASRALAFVGTAAFEAGAAADALRFEQDAAAGVTRVQADFDADAVADLRSSWWACSTSPPTTSSCRLGSRGRRPSGFPPGGKETAGRDAAPPRPAQPTHSYTRT